MSSQDSYVPLWCKSNFSFLEGASHPEELVEAAASSASSALALTDRDGVYGVVRAHVAAREAGVTLIIGSEVTLDDGSTIVLLAPGPRGLREPLPADHRRAAALRQGTSSGRLATRSASTPPASIALWGGERSLLAGDAEPVLVAHRPARGVRRPALRAWSTRHRGAEEVAQEARLRAARRALRRSRSSRRSRCSTTRGRGAPLQDVLTCIRHGVTLATAGPAASGRTTSTR